MLSWQRARRLLSREGIDVYDVALVGMSVGFVIDLATGQDVALMERLLSPVAVFFSLCVVAAILLKMANRRKRSLAKRRAAPSRDETASGP